jgi:D-alanine transfer protein
MAAKTPAPMDPHRLHTRLAAVAVGCALAAVAVGALFALYPAQASVNEDLDYGYVYSGAKSSSVEFLDAAMDEDSLLVLGSSEFSTPSSLVPQVPSALFGQANYGVDLMLVGEAYDQSLWQAIALGAIAGSDGGVPRNKVVLVVSPGWFADGGMDADTFQTRFSYTLWSAFCANPDVSDETKAYVAARLEAYGIDETTVEAGLGTLVTDSLNNLVLQAFDDLKLRRELVAVRAKGTERDADAAVEEPDFAALREAALADAAERTTTNDWGVEDAFWTTQLEPVLELAAGTRAGETYSQTPEYDDLACFLEVAEACGVEVLVVVEPVMGPYYDLIGIDEQTRAGCYERIRAVVEAAGAQIADFSDREYERYFLYDIVHFGWTGWVDVAEAVYDFAVGNGGEDLS